MRGEGREPKKAVGTARTAERPNVEWRIDHGGRHDQDTQVGEAFSDGIENGVVGWSS